MDLLDEARFQRRGDGWSQLLSTLRRHRQSIVLVFLATVIGAYATVEFVLWEHYESRANLLVRLGRENAEVPSTVQNSALFTSGIREQELRSIVYLLTSREMAARVVDRVGVEVFRFESAPPETLFQAVKYYAKLVARWAKRQVDEVLILMNLKKRLSDRDKAILAVEGALIVAPEKDSDVIAVRVHLPAPHLSVQVNEVLLEYFFESYVRLHKSNESWRFFDQQAEELRRQLAAADEQRERIRSRFGLSAAGEQRTLLLRRLNDAVRQIDQNESEKQMLREQQQVMRARLAAIPESLERSRVTTPNPAIQSIKERITSLQLDHAKLLGRYAPDHPLVVNVEDEIAALQATLRRERESQTGSVTSELNPLREGFGRSVEEIGAKIAGLDASSRKQREIVKAVEKEIAALDKGEDELEVLNRERKMAETNYLTYSKRREEARIREALDAQQVANVVLMSAPSRPIEPVAPRKLLIMAIALVLGLLLGVGLALALEYLRESVETPRDLAAVDDLPFLGTFAVDRGAGSAPGTKAG